MDDDDDDVRKAARVFAVKLLADFQAALQAEEPLTEERRRDLMYGFVFGCLEASEEAARALGLTWIDFVATASCVAHGTRTHVTEGEHKLHFFLHMLSGMFPDGDFPAPVGFPGPPVESPWDTEDTSELN